MRPYAIATALLLVSLNCNAQQARIIGLWRMDPMRSESAAQQDPAANTELAIKQTTKQLTVQMRQGSAERTISYNVDGSDTLSPLGSDSATGHMRWVGDQLVTDTIYNVRETAFAQTATYSLSSDGREMTVDYKLRVLHGYEGNHPDSRTKDPNYSTGKDVFVRR